MEFIQFMVLVIAALSLPQSKAFDNEHPSLNWYNLFSPLNYNLGIVNGEEVEESEWPFVASIQQAGHQHFCGGSVWNR